MRSFLVAFGCLVVVGCSSFSATDRDDASLGPADGDAPAATDNTPDQNAQGGTPIGGAAPAGVFVSASLGSDDGAGGQSDPLKSLAKAIEVAKQSNLPVNACADTYLESLAVSDGVSMYGYYDCSKMPWSRGTQRALVLSPTSPAIIAHSLQGQTRIEGFEVHAPDFDSASATDSDGSSIGLDVRDAKALTFSNVLIMLERRAAGSMAPTRRSTRGATTLRRAVGRLTRPGTAR